MACPHFDQIASLKVPKLSQQVHREECTQCFDNQDIELGIDVCLTCFNGGCVSQDRHHAMTHHQKSSHPFSLNIKRRRKPQVERTDEEPPLKKLAIREEREDETYVYSTELRCWGCGGDEGKIIKGAMDYPQIQSLSSSILTSQSSARQSEVKAWEEELATCEHTLLLQQDPVHIPIATHCSQCQLPENLWLCLTCGNVGCGRQQFGGVDGNSHGLKHFEETAHPVSVKLGTITPEGTADLYCYLCNDTRLSPALPNQLLTLGIQVSTQLKTEKSITELQLEQNLKFEFSLVDESGRALEPVFGPGKTGLQNLGNSCYMASTVQVLFSLKEFRLRYLPTATLHPLICPQALPADCVDCQMHKLADGLLSGRYSVPRTSPDPSLIVAPNPEDPIFQVGLRPMGFKSLIGKGHSEFATMRQQDSEEFLSHLLHVLRAYRKKAGVADVEAASSVGKEEPTEVFRFGIEQRLMCGECGRVRYRVDESDVASVPVPAVEKKASNLDEKGETKKEYESVKFETCIEGLMGVEGLEYNCPACQKKVVATKRNRFASFPKVLVVHARKFQLVNWVPTKLDVPILLPSDDIITLDSYLGHGLDSSETELPGDSSTSTPSLPEFNAEAMAQLEGMGFPVIRCQKALLATGNSSAETAMEWLFEHMEDPDIDDPIQLGSSTSVGPEPSAEQVSALSDMGFTPMQARKALKETDGNPERAVEWLFSHSDETGEEIIAPASSSAAPTSVPGTTALPSRYKLKAFVSHKGPSVHSGHYVAHIRLDEGWVFFNDEKVVKADKESLDDLKKLAYLYFFERI